MKVEYSKLNQVEEGASPADDANRLQLESNDHPPPPGVKSGGVWGTTTYCGSQTKCSSALCCLIGGGSIPLCIHCCFPFDKRRVYKVDGNIYNTEGNVACPKRDTLSFEFEKEELDGSDPINHGQRKLAWMFSGFFVCVLWLLRIATMKY